MIEELAIQPTRRKRMQLLRSLMFNVLREREGASTLAAMRGMRDRTSCHGIWEVVVNSREAAGDSSSCLRILAMRLPVGYVVD